MRKDHEDRIDPTRPALIVLYGATRRKFRPLESDVVVLGRAPGCDIGLVSPEVAPVHCVIVRLGTGWRIRDCSGRSTRVNGQAVHDEPLRNGDTIQVGTFSFEAQLPPSPQVPHAPGASAPPAQARIGSPEDALQIERLQDSRRRLAELALGLRRKMREQSSSRDDLEHQQQDLEQVERRLRTTHQEQQTRQAELTALKESLDKRSAELDAYARNLRRSTEKLRQDQDDLLRQVETDRAGYEADLVRQRVEANQERERLQQWQQELQARQAELEGTAGQLEEMLRGEREQLEHDREQLANDRDQVTREREYLDRQREEVIQQRAELDRIKEQTATQTPMPVSSRETQLDQAPADRLESARKLLRELAERRKGGTERTGTTPPPPKGSRSRQVRVQQPAE